MRIAQVVASLDPDFGGPSIVVPALADALVRRGHDVCVFTTDRGLGRTFTPPPNGLWQTVVGHQHAPRRWASSWPLTRLLHERLRDFDHVIVHSLYLCHGAVACAIARRQGLSHSVRPHGALDGYHFERNRRLKQPYERLVEWRNLEGASFVHCTSEREAEALRSLNLRIRLKIFPLGTQLPNLLEPVQRNGSTLVFLGRITAKKNLGLVVEALRHLPDKVRLVVAGPDEEGLGQTIRRRATELGLAHRLQWYGPVHGEAKWVLLRSCALFVLPSLDESFGIAVIEALAAETPVVVSPHVAVGHAAVSAGAGWFTDLDPAGIARVVAEALSHPDVLQARGRAGRELVRTSFSWDRVAEFYEEAVA